MCCVKAGCERYTLCSCDRSGRGDGSPAGSTESPVYPRAASHTPAQRERENKHVLEMIPGAQRCIVNTGDAARYCVNNICFTCVFYTTQSTMNDQVF